MGVLWDPRGDCVRPFALSAASEVGDGDRDGSSMAEAAASVLAVGTLAQPAIAIAEPSASTHHRDPLIHGERVLPRPAARGDRRSIAQERFRSFHNESVRDKDSSAATAYAPGDKT